jgi:hypothetical protein
MKSYTTGADMKVRAALLRVFSVFFILYSVGIAGAGNAAAFFTDGNIFLTVWETGDGGKEITIDLATIGYDGSNIDGFATSDEDGDGQNGYAELLTPDLSFFNTSNVDDLYVALWGGTDNTANDLIADRDNGDEDIFFSSTVSDASLIDVSPAESGSFVSAAFVAVDIFSRRDSGVVVGGVEDERPEEGVVGLANSVDGSFGVEFRAGNIDGTFGSFFGIDPLLNESGPDENSGFLSLSSSDPLFLYHYFTNVEFSFVPVPGLVRADPVPVTGGPIFGMTFEETDDNRLKFIFSANQELSINISNLQAVLNSAVQDTELSLEFTVSDGDIASGSTLPDDFSFSFRGDDADVLNDWFSVERAAVLDDVNNGVLGFRLVGTPAAEQVGFYEIDTFVAEDGSGGSVELALSSFTVANVQDIPELDPVPSFNDPCLIFVGSPFDSTLALNAVNEQKVLIIARDLDIMFTQLGPPADSSQIPTFSFSGDTLPGLSVENLLVRSTEIRADLIFDPTAGAAEGDYSITLTIDDGIDSASQDFVVRVITAEAPSIVTGAGPGEQPSLSPRFNAPFSFTPDVEDGDGVCDLSFNFSLALDGSAVITDTRTLSANTGLSFDFATGELSGTVSDAGLIGTIGTYTLTVVDDTGLTGQVEYQFLVQDLQDAAPVIEDIDLLAVFACGALENGRSISPSDNFAPVVSDANQGSDNFFDLNFSALGLPNGLSINENTGAITGTINVPGLADLNFSRTFPITVTVTDNAGLSDSTQFDLVVFENAAPEFREAPLSIINISQVVDFDSDTNPNYIVDVFDINAGVDCAHSLTYGIAISEGGTSLTPGDIGLTFDASDGGLSGQPSRAGTFDVTLSVTDNGGLSDSTTFSLVVTTEVPPILEPVSDLTIVVNTPVDIVPVVTNRDPDNIVFSITVNGSDTLPDGLSFNTASGALSGTPTEIGVFDILIVADDVDGDLSGPVGFTLTVFNNIAPIIQPSDLEPVNVGEDFSFSPVVTESNPGVGELLFSADGLPLGLNINTSNGFIFGQAQAALTDAQGEFLPYIFTITVTDTITGLSAEQSYSLFVLEDVAPDITNTPDSNSVRLGDSYSFVPEVFDPNAGVANSGHSLVFSATGLPDGLSLDTQSGALSGTPTVAGNSIISLIVTDNTGLSDALVFNFEIFTNEAPVFIEVPGETTVQFETPVSLTVRASDSNSANDAEHDLFFDVFGLPEGLAFMEFEDGIVIDGTSTRPGAFTITVRVTDNRGASSATAFKVNFGLTPAQSEARGCMPASLLLLIQR